MQSAFEALITAMEISTRVNQGTTRVLNSEVWGMFNYCHPAAPAWGEGHSRSGTGLASAALGGASTPSLSSPKAAISINTQREISHP